MTTPNPSSTKRRVSQVDMDTLIALSKRLKPYEGWMQLWGGKVWELRPSLSFPVTEIHAEVLSDMRSILLDRIGQLEHAVFVLRRIHDLIHQYELEG